MTRSRAIFALAALLAFAATIGLLVRGNEKRAVALVEPVGPTGEDIDVSLGAALVGDSTAGPEARPNTGAESERMAMGADHAFEGVRHVSGIVTNRVDGEPIAEARVHLVAGEFALQLTTAEDGTFAEPWSAEGTPSIEVQHEGFAAMRRAEVEFAEPIRFELQPLGGIEGRVTGARLPAGVPHTIGVWSQYELARGNDPLQEVELDDQGKFRITGLDRGVLGVALLAPYGVVCLTTGVTVLPGEISEVELVRSEGTRLAVRIETGPNRAAVPGVILTWLPIHQGVGREYARTRAQVITGGGDGSFVLEDLPPSDVLLEATMPWSGGARRIARLTPPLTEIAWRVNSPLLLNGRVVDYDGAAAVGAIVTTAVKQSYQEIESLDALAGTIPETITRKVAGTQGQFQFEQASGMSTLLMAMPADGSLRFGTAQVHKGRYPKQEIQVNLPQPRVVRGLVVDVEGNPVAGAQVTTTLRIRQVDYLASRSIVVTGADGTWSQTVGAGMLVKGTVEHSELGAATYQVPADASAPVRVVLDPGHTLHGRFVDTEGFAIAGAQVLVQAYPKYRSRTTFTADEFGRFQVKGLPSAPVSLQEPRATGFRLGKRIDLTMPEAANEVVTIVLEPASPRDPATIEGEIVLHNQQLPVPGLRFDRLRGAAVSLEGTRFRITGLRPGRISLTAKAPGLELLPLGTVFLDPGETRDVGRFELRPVSRLTVRVSTGGKPVEGATVSVRRLSVEKGGRPWGSRTFESKATKRKGEYRVDSLPRYRWKLVVSHPKYKTYSIEFMASGRNTTLRPKLKPKK